MKVILVERSNLRAGDVWAATDWNSVNEFMNDRGAEYQSGESYKEFDDGPILRKEVWKSVTLGITWYCKEVMTR